jgi:hypothetical protein
LIRPVASAACAIHGCGLDNRKVEGERMAEIRGPGWSQEDEKRETERWSVDPAEVPTESSEALWSWMREAFRDGPTSRACDLSGEQLAELRDAGVAIVVATPFGRLCVCQPIVRGYA